MELYGPLQKGEILTHDRILRNTTDWLILNFLL